ncbi:hypothetical protein T11_17956 [Trichinella zimbabwensis]|uniref:CCHC-type domain-containing protein n=1 Tax=Trichinella zimbabwensis TaxID=268475 RepID=A0A0V1I2M8_9BILA|nr:hypothetical protein T11_17956 [Trichinella zimbabwensis]
MTKKIEELAKKLDRTKKRVNDLIVEIERRYAEGAEIERIEAMTMRTSITETAERKAASGEGKEQLTPFDGDIMQFSAFWDQFQASVHARTDLNDIEKFICLRSNLKGPALDVISGFSITAANYPEAVKTLRERFDRADLIIQHHILQIAEIKKVAESSPSELRKVYDKIMLHLRALRAMGKDPITEQLTADEIFLALFKKAVPPELNRKWEELIESKASTTANLESFLEFVRKQIDIEEKVSTQERTRCHLCQKCHEISTCIQFLASDVDERWRTAKRLGLCHSCLERGHRRRDCVTSRKTATGQSAIHDLLNKRDTDGKKIDEKTEENITRVGLETNADINKGSYISGPKEQLPLKGVESDDNLCVINALCVSHICDKVPPNPPMEGYEHLKGLKLADKFPREEIEIDLLIGIDHYYDVVLNEIIWGKNISQNQTHSLHCQVDEDCKCECDVIKKFWEVEAMGTEERNESEVNILERFKNEVTFDGERYMKKGYNNARAKEYDEVIKTYMEKGWIEETKGKDESNSGHPDKIPTIQDRDPSGHLKDVAANTIRPRR